MRRRPPVPRLVVTIACAATLLLPALARAAPGELFVEVMAGGSCNWTHRGNQDKGFVCVWKEGSGGPTDHTEERCFGFRYLPDSTLGNLWSSGCKAPPPVCHENGISRFATVTTTTGPRPIDLAHFNAVSKAAADLHDRGDFVLGWKSCVEACNQLATAAGLVAVAVDPKLPMGPEEYVQELKKNNPP